VRRVGLVAVALVLAAACGGQELEPQGEEAADPTTTAAGAAETAPTTTAAPAPDGPPTQAADVASSPEGLVDQLTGAEQAVRDPATAGDELAHQAHVQQVAYRVLAEHPDWVEEVVGGLPEALREDATRHVAARQEFIGMHTELQDGPPDWRIVAPPPADDLLAYYQEAEAAFGVEWEVLAAVNLVETGLGRIRGVSSAGALGPMQFLPGTWERWGEGDVEDPHDAILAAGRYLGASGAADGDLDAALFEYNNHNNYVRGVTRYADIMRADPDTFRGFYHWQIYYRTTGGDLLLPEGYPDVPAAEL